MPTGSCLCGAVCYELEPPLSGIELCHCRKCRKAYGSPFAATLYARRSDFRWLRGEEWVSRWDAPLEISAPAYRHSFCRKCGSPLPLLWDELPFVEVPVAGLDGAVDVRPAYQMFESQRLAWSHELGALPSHDRGAPLRDKVFRSLF